MKKSNEGSNYPPVYNGQGIVIEDTYDLDSSELYLNRELTLLSFNQRVLSMAKEDSTPLLERVKFLAIVSSNLDEFFMKRIGGLKQRVFM